MPTRQSMYRLLGGLLYFSTSLYQSLLQSADLSFRSRKSLNDPTYSLSWSSTVITDKPNRDMTTTG